MAVKVLIKRMMPESKANELMPLFRRLRNLATNQPGYISGETLKRVDKPGEFLIISTWQSIDDWGEYVVSKERTEIQNEIDVLIGTETTYEIYQYG